MEKKISLQVGSNKQLMVGIGLIALGILMPVLLDIHRFGVYPMLDRALAEGEKTYVLHAAIQLLLLNILRGLPHYLGAFYVVDTVTLYYRQRPQRWFSIPLLTGLVLLVYTLISILYNIHYDLGVPMILLMAVLLLLMYIDFSLVSSVKKAVMIFFLLCTVQCLDVLPLLNGRGFGRGDASFDIKSVSSFLDADPLLNAAILTLAVVLGINALLYTILIVDENHIKLASIRHEEQQRKLMEARNHLELRHLVHDLKTPLTSMQTLVGLLQLQDPDPKRQEYLGNIEWSINRLSDLISEFLDEQRFSRHTMQDLITDIMSQISNMPYVSMIHTDMPQENLWVYVNKIRFSRMMVNLIENAYHAMDKEEGRMDLLICREELDGQPMIKVALSDNGKGIDAVALESIFQSGFSTRGSSGLGLAFVKEVVERHKGQITVTSKLQVGTTFTIYLPEDFEDGE